MLCENDNQRTRVTNKVCQLYSLFNSAERLKCENVFPFEDMYHKPIADIVEHLDCDAMKQMA